MGQPIDGQPFVAAAVLGHQPGDRAAEGPRSTFSVGAGGEIIKRRHHAILIDRRQVGNEMGVIGVIEQCHRPLSENQHAARLVMTRPDLHVGRIGGVARVDLIEQKDTGIVARLQFPADPAQAIEPDRIEIDRRPAEFHGPVLARRLAAARGFDGMYRQDETPLGMVRISLTKC